MPLTSFEERGPQLLIPVSPSIELPDHHGEFFPTLRTLVTFS
jgi:hypothetical protein